MLIADDGDTDEQFYDVRETVSLNKKTVATFKVARELHATGGPPDSQNRITSASFHHEGRFLATASESNTLHIWNLESEEEGYTDQPREEGAQVMKEHSLDLVRFTHHSAHILCSGVKEFGGGFHDLRLFDAANRQDVLVFRGHKERISSLQMAPLDNTFISSAYNESVKLWDMRRQQPCTANLRIAGLPTVAYSPDGRVFAVALAESKAIILYDVSMLRPFATINVEVESNLTSLQFACTADRLLVGTSDGSHLIIDVLREKKVIYHLTGHKGIHGEKADLAKSARRATTSGQELTFTPDGRWVFGGSRDGLVCVWEIPQLSSVGVTTLDAIQPTAQLRGHETYPGGQAEAFPSVIEFNPRTAVLMTASTHANLWLPDPDDGTGEEYF